MTRIISIVGGMQPSAPTIGTATAGDTSASVAFTASSYIGKGTITYTATSSPGGLTATGASSPLTVSGLTNGTAYTFTVVGNTNYGVASIASAASNSITPATQSSYESIATVTVGAGGASSVQFTSIPATYKHLQIRGILKSTTAGNDNWAWSLQGYLNGDNTVANYAYHRLRGDGGTVTASGGADAIGQLGFIPSAGLTNIFAPTIIDILDYSNTNKYKTFRAINGSDTNGTNQQNVGFQSQLWKNTAAVNAIEFFAGSTGTFAQYTHIALYGIKG